MCDREAVVEALLVAHELTGPGHHKGPLLIGENLEVEREPWQDRRNDVGYQQAGVRANQYNKITGFLCTADPPLARGQ